MQLGSPPVPRAEVQGGRAADGSAPCPPPPPPQTDTPSVNIGDRLGEDTSSSLSANREEQKSQPPSVAWARTRRNSVRFRNSKLRPKSFAHSLPSLGVQSCRNLPLQILAHPVCFGQDGGAGKRSASSRDHMKVTDRRPISDRQASWNSGDPEGAVPTLVGWGRGGLGQLVHRGVRRLRLRRSISALGVPPGEQGVPALHRAPQPSAAGRRGPHTFWLGQPAGFPSR